MNKTTTNQAIRRYIELRGLEIIESGWAHGQDKIDYIARDGEDGDLVFIAAETHYDAGEGIPAAKPDRNAFERLAAATDCLIGSCFVGEYVRLPSVSVKRTRTAYQPDFFSFLMLRLPMSIRSWAFRVPFQCKRGMVIKLCQSCATLSITVINKHQIDLIIYLITCGFNDAINNGSIQARCSNPLS